MLSPQQRPAQPAEQVRKSMRLGNLRARLAMMLCFALLRLAPPRLALLRSQVV
jgi:hypothetical protein